MNRKITFPFLPGSKTIRRHTETGIEIHNGGADGWSVVVPQHPGVVGHLAPLHADTYAAARDEAFAQVYSMRQTMAYDEIAAYGVAARMEVAEALGQGTPVVEHEGLRVVFRSTCSAALRGVVFEIEKISRSTAVSDDDDAGGGDYRFAGLRRHSGGRWGYRTALLTDLRTADGGRLVAPAGDSAVDPLPADAAAPAGRRPGRRLMVPVVDDPRVLIVGDPVGGFAYYGPSPHDSDSREARTRLIEENNGGDWWLAPLRPVSDLAPVDGEEHDEPDPIEVKREQFLRLAAEARAHLADGGDPAARGQGYELMERALALAEELLA